MAKKFKVRLDEKQKNYFQELLRKKSKLHPKVLPRIQALLAKNEGKTTKEIAQALNVHRNSITSWIKIFKEKGEKGILRLNYKGKKPFLNEKQRKELEKELEKKLFTRLKDIQELVENKFKVTYTSVGLWKLLRNKLGYVRKGTGLTPGKGDPKKQFFFYTNTKN